MFDLIPFFISIIFGILAVLTIIMLVGMCKIIEEDVLEANMLRTYRWLKYDTRRNR
jgi:hypothetical protein